MELTGFEPVTSSMPLKHATNCAIAPYKNTKTNNNKFMYFCVYVFDFIAML